MLLTHAYRVLNLETNRVVETYEVTFDETMPHSILVFECAANLEIGESIFVEEEQEDADWGDPEPTPSAAPLEPTTSTSAHDPNPSSSIYSSSLLSLRQRHLRRPQLLLRGRRLLQRRQHDTFSIATHLRP